jgi:hypothetical protein
VGLVTCWLLYRHVVVVAGQLFHSSLALHCPCVCGPMTLASCAVTHHLYCMKQAIADLALVVGLLRPMRKLGSRHVVFGLFGSASHIALS